jgi:predicted acyltransferase
MMCAMPEEPHGNNQTPAQTSLPERVVSVDVLRGFDMFWLIGGTGVALALARLCPPGLRDMLLPQFEHAPWAGFRFYDLIFPLFVFMVGMSLVFSLGKRLEREGRWSAYRRLLRRGLLLFLMGLFYYGGLRNRWPDIRLLGVLQRLALCYLAGGILFIHLKPRGLIAACAVLLLGYWALLSFVPVPGVGGTSFAEGENWANYIDKQWLPGHKHDGEWDPEGLLSTLPAIGSCLLGVLAALLLGKGDVRPSRKVLCFVGGGALMVAVGFLWGLQFPVIKKIWTSSYVLVAGGYSFMLLGVLYVVVDVWKFRRWALPLLWIGANPLTIYMAKNILDFNQLGERFVGGDVKAFAGEQYGYLLYTLASLTLTLAVVRFLYNRKIFLRL